MKTRFLKIKGIKHDFDMTRCHFFNDLTDHIEWVRMIYARDYYWIKKKDFCIDVPIPNERPSYEEFWKYWNWHLNKIIYDFENGILLENLIDEEFFHKNIFILDFTGEYVYLVYHDNDDFVCEDITKEFTKKIIDKINPTEIEEFVNTHTKEEVEKKYSVVDECEMWALSAIT